MRIVLTGPASSGKTTLIKKLKTLKYAVVSESAREIINRSYPMRPSGTTWKRWRSNTANEQKFQAAVALNQLSKEILLEDAGTRVFLDRGVCDGIAYCRLKNVPIPKILSNAKQRYDLVLLLDPLAYKKDSRRIHSEEENERVHGLLKAAYKDLGYKCVRIPNFDPKADLNIQKRIELILRETERAERRLKRF